MEIGFKNILFNNLLTKASLCSILILAAISFFDSGCKKDDVVPQASETATMTDIDNNVYKTIKIGNQWWMAENLKVTKFRNGSTIIQNQDAADWNSCNASYCVYSNNNNAPGLLYNWFAVNDTNILAPAGWHIANDNDWKELEKYLGMSSSDAEKKGWRGTNEGEKLKIDGLKGWTEYQDIWSTNESGFTALAGSCRLFNGVWGDPGLFSTGFWWTASVYPGGKDAWYRYLDYKSTKIFRSYGNQNYGFSVRCVRD